MKLLLALLATVGLSGCVAYGSPYGAPYYGSAEVHYSTSPYYGSYYGGSVPYVVEQPIYRRGYHGGHHRGYRDRDGDGIANRADRDRDGDGVRNRRDSHPNNPRRN